MLKNLDGDHVVEVGNSRLVCEKVAADQPLGRQRRPTRLETADRFGRDVEPDQLEAGIHEWQIIPTIAATDVETGARIVRCVPKRLDDASYERQRRLVGIALVTILRVPARRGQTTCARFRRDSATTSPGCTRAGRAAPPPHC